MIIIIVIIIIKVVIITIVIRIIIVVIRIRPYRPPEGLNPTVRQATIRIMKKKNRQGPAGAQKRNSLFKSVIKSTNQNFGVVFRILAGPASA